MDPSEVRFHRFFIGENLSSGCFSIHKRARLSFEWDEAWRIQIFCWNEIPFRFETLVNKNVDSSKSNHCLVIDSKWEWLEFSEYVANGACCFDDKRFDSFHWFEWSSMFKFFNHWFFSCRVPFRFLIDGVYSYITNHHQKEHSLILTLAKRINITSGDKNQRGVDMIIKKSLVDISLHT